MLTRDATVVGWYSYVDSRVVCIIKIMVKKLNIILNIK